LIQWRTATILTAPNLLSNVPEYASMADIGMVFIDNPELTFTNSNLTLNQTQAQFLFEVFDPEADPKQITLLNPDNMYDFYYNLTFNPSQIPVTLDIDAE
jgi:hypothetical protein